MTTMELLRVRECVQAAIQYGYELAAKEKIHPGEITVIHTNTFMAEYNQRMQDLNSEKF